MSDPTEIPNWLRVDERITSSGQPSADQIAALHAMGAKYVMNLAPHSHEQALVGEGEMVTALGMTYVHIPVAFDAPTEGDFARFCVAMHEIGNEPVHVHCIVNARVSAFLYRYLRDVVSVNEELAREPMDRLWQPGGVWAAFIGDPTAIDQPHRGPRYRP